MPPQPAHCDTVFSRLEGGCFAVLVLYFLALGFSVFQSATTVRGSLLLVSNSLNVSLPERTYGSDCRIYTPENPHSSFANVKDVVWDIFVLPHTFGWICGQLLLRDWRIAWIISIAFEVFELSLMHWLPNFNECWWDHVFDVLICNALGIYVGSKILQRWEMQEYDWLGIDATHRPTRNCLYLTSLGRFWQVNLMLLTVSFMMLNAFFLKSVLWVPSDHWLNVARLLLWYSTGPFGMAEYYRHITGVGGVGYRCLLCAAVIALESYLWIKCGLADFTAPFPTIVIMFWQIFAGVLAIFTAQLAFAM